MAVFNEFKKTTMRGENFLVVTMLLGGMAFSACSNGDDEQLAKVNNFGPMTSVSVAMAEQGDKALRSAAADGAAPLKPVFAVGDKLLVTDGTNDAIFESQADDPSQFSMLVGPAPSEGLECIAFYPGWSCMGVNAGRIYFSGADTLLYEEGSAVAHGSYPMLAKSSTGRFDFQPLYAFMRVNVQTGSEDEVAHVQSVKLSRMSGPNMSGANFTASFNNNEPVVEGGSLPFIVLKCDSAEVTNLGRSFCIAFPPGEYDSLMVQVKFTDGNVFSSAPRELSTYIRSAIYTTDVVK